MKAKFASTCADCKRPIKTGDPIGIIGYSGRYMNRPSYGCHSCAQIAGNRRQEEAGEWFC